VNALFSQIQIKRYAPGLIMGAHAHPDSSLILVLSGRYEERIRGRSDLAESGSLLVYAPEEPHAQRFGSAAVRKLVLTPTPEALGRLGEAVPVAQAPALRSRALAELGQRMVRELQTDDDFSSLVLCGLSHELIGLSAREQAVRHGALPRKLRLAMAFIREQSQEAFALEAIAAAVACDAGELARTFRAHLGTTPGDYHRRMRVEHAAALLEASSRHSLADVAMICGFSDQPHMTRAFKAQLGVTPGQYRRRACGR